tara:strand:- start:1153 stop:1842 length:690 start_codon:yes stop_codon:yes gene_type:complete
MIFTILIPVFNEEKTIKEILDKISKIKIENVNFEIIVIDDGSNDKTKNILENNASLYNKLISYERNQGKGHAIKKGLNAATGKYVIIQDADLEYEPSDINKFISLIKKFDSDLIIGSRFNYSEYSRSHNILNKFGNIIITLIFNILNNTTFTDIYSCYICFKKELLDTNNLKSVGFDQQAEILSQVVKRGDKFFEVPINYNGRTAKEGKKIKFYHIFNVIFRIIIGRIK